MPRLLAPVSLAPVLRAIGVTSLALVGVTVAATGARGAEPTEIASVDDVGNKPHVELTVDYSYEAKRAAVRREWQRTAVGNAPPGIIPVVQDLLFQQNRHTITPRLAVGFYDFELSASLPIVLSDTRELSLDQSGDPCIFEPAPVGQEPTCVNRQNSSTVRDVDDANPGFGDALLPAEGYDAEDPLTNFPEDGKTVFRGVRRSGLDQLHIGLNWAATNQARDDTKPTWVLGVELRYAIGKIARFNRMNPGSEDGVSRGVHEFRAHTSFSKRSTWAEPYVSFWWMAPIGLRGDTPGDNDSSLFWNVGFGQERQMPQQQAGTIFGLEAWAWEDKRQNQHVTIQLEGSISAHFAGKGYSEMWEVFSYAGDAVNNPNGPLVLDPDPTNGISPPMDSLSHPGVTEIENYLSGTARLGVRGQMGDHAKFGASFQVAFDQGHIITFTDAGNDINGSGTIDACAVGDPVEECEVNPLHKPLIDTVGRRYIVDNSLTFGFFVHGTLMF